MGVSYERGTPLQVLLDDYEVMETLVQKVLSNPNSQTLNPDP